jgi:hypothetical protein
LKFLCIGKETDAGELAHTVSFLLGSLCTFFSCLEPVFVRLMFVSFTQKQRWKV